ncbi:MAG TPA: aminomethyl-transferring glycine dehydrogenase subunit GcvPA [bacterium]|nr:aminomethyl-transferring glycine dehydrogenase subunit GcvPA [bacterium]
MPFIPTTDSNRKEMLKTIGVSDFEELLQPVPEKIRFKKAYDLPQPLSELEVTGLLHDLAAKNEHGGTHTCFLGGGAYDHFIPAAVGHVTSRSEFYTAYTPYQPEVSQGNLQAIYEYQTMIANLTGMDVANASMYDGASSLAEAALLAHTQTRRPEILVSKAVHPFYRETVKTYCMRSGVEVREIDIQNGGTDPDSLRGALSDQTAGVLVQHPNFFGCLEEVESMEKIVHEAGGLFVVSVDPISLGLLKPPGQYGADVATGEGQSLGNSVSFGGPYVGIFTVKQELIRRLPGRLVGVTMDSDEKRGFVLTLQTREQHIRREKATSSICTNQQLCALASTVYLALMGKAGIRTVAHLSTQKAHYMAGRLAELPGVDRLFSRPFFKEFAVRLPVSPQKAIDALRKEKIFAGIDLDRFDYGIKDGLLIAVTEKRTRGEIDRYMDVLKNLL